MASNTVVIDGKRYRRSKKQGRKPSGLSKPIKIRLYEDDTEKLAEYARQFGYYWNFNEFIRGLVHKELCNFVPQELVNT